MYFSVGKKNIAENKSYFLYDIVNVMILNLSIMRLYLPNERMNFKHRLITTVASIIYTKRKFRKILNSEENLKRKVPN